MVFSRGIALLVRLRTCILHGGWVSRMHRYSLKLILADQLVLTPLLYFGTPCSQVIGNLRYLLFLKGSSNNFVHGILLVWFHRSYGAA